jgi:glycosyltransferase involved in cell wall biosynthesis
MLDEPGIEFIGEINENAKSEFLGQAAGLLFPIGWPEPFGLVMIEAMACGTPVLAFRCGSVPEIVEDGATGCIVSDIDQAVGAISKLLALDRRTIRSRFEERFSSARMAADYIRVYQKILRKNSAPEPQPSSLAALPATTNGHGHSREVASAVRQDVETKKRDAIAAMRNAQP